ncbi:ABC transporter ATP-binding protein [Hydrogenophaga sp.]|uniref:ABC transporter ATP-binding protein n=1 Tax=Hydrogenophaga sp. TaxID=1904254 RepID=UPI00272F5A8D|nr:ABC transporter ATP-binding protein [Hydrogenophaga sp.]MDP2076258.1 ABC transporter ATP-binding protein [Hydrogenophaga sp.]MDP2986273.1 ABC transporter ATP-binding protein [Hydrogenophaga sp.]MDP3109482.1 ABC transporter ATP-binding protein [Hydrogenophaga sp.]MDP3347841.1 ABC transporter ATP-binding protein [Hydrogenophaga sp.]MDZ4396754.1 ABC transporter ATP-binding protein [Hydrogenophaga sp.]
MTALLQVTNLRIGYPARVVGESISLSLSGGEVLALLGPNGCGKTTLLKTVLGVLPPRAGEIELDGRPLRDWSLAERARCVAYVPQGQASTFGFTALEMVLMGRTAHLGLLARPGARDRAIAQDALKRLGMAHLSDRSVHHMSGGERQMVLIARALAQQPRAVLLDEPTASLDFGNQGLVLRAVRTLAQEGLAVLLTTHDPNQALRCADRALLMREGTVISQGPVREVVTADSLRALYSAEVLQVATEGEQPAVFLPWIDVLQGQQQA